MAVLIACTDARLFAAFSCPWTPPSPFSTLLEIERCEEALQLFRAIGHRQGEAVCLWSLGEVHQGLEEYPQAWASYEEALQLFRDLGDGYRIADVFWSMGRLFAKAGERQDALCWIEQAVQLFEEIGVNVQADRAREQAKVWRGEEGTAIGD